jgi:hypothetical protein
MRLDEAGNNCPSTLGEYWDLCHALVLDADKSHTLKWLNEKIAIQGRDQPVIAPDSQMRAILFPLLQQDLQETGLHPGLFEPNG